MASDESFTSWLKRRRKALDLTQAELAHKVGCSIYTVQRIEEGVARPSRQLAELIAAGLDIPFDERPAFVQRARALAGRSGNAPQHPPASAQPSNPYKGLRAFGEADAPDFFGREALTERLRERLAEDAELARFLAVSALPARASPVLCAPACSLRCVNSQLLALPRSSSIASPGHGRLKSWKPRCCGSRSTRRRA